MLNSDFDSNQIILFSSLRHLRIKKAQTHTHNINKYNTDVQVYLRIEKLAYNSRWETKIFIEILYYYIKTLIINIGRNFQ